MSTDNKGQKASNNKKTDTSRDLQQNAGENVVAAHNEALADIDQDPDLSIHSPNDDLDEGETARLGEDKTDLV